MGRTHVVAVIGCGAIANLAHIPSYVKNPNAEIKYFCDIIPERAEAAVQKYGCGIAVTDYKEVLADPEVEAVATYVKENYINHYDQEVMDFIERQAEPEAAEGDVTGGGGGGDAPALF